MSSIDDLKTVLSEALENKGVTNELKSKLRAEVFNILEDNSNEKPIISQENLLINELIREYMDFNHYKYSKSVFLKESNQPSTPLNREIIAAELHIKEDKTTKQVPLIYSLLWHFLNNNDITRLEQEEIMRQYALNDAKSSTIAVNPSNKYSFDVNNKKTKTNSNASNITIHKYKTEHDQLE